METKFIATYARVSTERQEVQDTVQNQLGLLREHANNNKQIIIEEYIDEGWSGDILERPALDRLRTDARMKKFQAVLIYDPDRLARRYSFQELVMDELREAGIEVMFITVASPKNSEEKILHGVRGLFAEYEREKIKERFRIGKIRKIKAGIIFNAEAPYGYTYIRIDENGNPGYYQINPYESEVVKKIFDWAASGVSCHDIVLRLARENIKPRKSKRELWSRGYVSRVLKNTTYIGEAKWRTTEAVIPKRPIKKDVYRRQKKTSRRQRPENEWYTVKVPAIIEPEQFEKVQRQIQLNIDLSKRNKKFDYLLSGLIYCTCGKRRAGENVKGSYNNVNLYYRCTDRLAKFPSKRTCMLGQINAARSDEVIWEAIVALMQGSILHSVQATRIHDQKSKETSNVEEEISRKTIQCNKYSEQLDKYVNAYSEGIITIEKLKSLSIRIQQEISRLEEEITELTEPKGKETLQQYLISREQIRQLFQCDFSANLSFSQKKAIVNQVISRVESNKETLVVYTHLPSENVELCSNNRNSQSTNQLTAAAQTPYTFSVKIPQFDRSGFMIARNARLNKKSG